MSIFRICCLALVTFLIAGYTYAGEKFLLSDNITSGHYTADFPDGTKLLPTGMSYSFETTGEFATDSESVKTGGDKNLFDGNAGSNWKSRSYSKWGSGEWVTVNLDLKIPYAISDVDVWTLHEETRDSDSVQLLFSKDGKTYTPQARATVDEKVQKQKNLITKITISLAQPVLAQYLQIRIHRLKSAKQQQVAEIAVWGSKPEKNVSYLEAGTRPKVVFDVEKVQSGVALITWEPFARLARDVKEWKVYRSSKPFSRVDENGVQLLTRVNGDETQATIFPLTPGESFFLGVSAVYPEGEFPGVEAQPCVMPLPLACPSFGAMVAINHFWGGGGNRAKDDRDWEAYETVALDLLQQCGIRQIRWWTVDRNIYLKYYAKGIGVYTYTHGNNLQAGNALGVWAFAGAGNEPDLSGKPIENYLSRLKTVYANKQKICPAAVICAPSSGLEDTSIAWLDQFYQQGGKEAFDVLDLHTYCKIAGGHTEPEGYPKGAPEAMFDNMRKIREVVSKYGDETKPVISTEFGYSEAIPNNPSGKITPLIKAQYLVRGLIIHNVLGFKRVFLYSFFDEGNDTNFTEHTFGLIDYNLQKKPAYYAVQTSIRTLGDCVLVSEIKGLPQPAFGYHYRSLDEKRQVYVLWDGTGRRRVNFKSAEGRITLTDMMGATSSIIPEQDGTFSVICSASPFYVQSTQPLEYVDTQQLAQESVSNLPELTLPNLQQIVDHNAKEAFFSVSSVNETAHESTARVVVSDEKGTTVLDRSLTIPSGKSEAAQIVVPLDSAGPALQKFTVQLIAKSDEGNFAKEHQLFVRRLPPMKKEAQTESELFIGIEKPLFSLSNESVVATIDVCRGARILELIDRQSKTNQINLDYALLPTLPSIPYAYGIWSTVNGKLKNSEMKVLKADKGVLEVSAEADRLVVIRTWTLQGNTLTLATKITNNNASPMKISYRVHPEYCVGGTGDSVTDVFLLPINGNVEKLPFWSGLGEKQIGILNPFRWGIHDSQGGIALTQSYDGNEWSAPRIWFGQGSYNVEMQSKSDLTVPAGDSWSSTLTWTVLHPITQQQVADLLVK